MDLFWWLLQLVIWRTWIVLWPPDVAKLPVGQERIKMSEGSYLPVPSPLLAPQSVSDHIPFCGHCFEHAV